MRRDSIAATILALTLCSLTACSAQRGRQGLYIAPHTVTLPLGQDVAFTATVYHHGHTVSASPSTVTWEAHNVAENRPARISRQGTFTARLPGLYRITAKTAHYTGHALVRVPDRIVWNPNELPSNVTNVTAIGPSDTPPRLPQPPLTGLAR